MKFCPSEKYEIRACTRDQIMRGIDQWILLRRSDYPKLCLEQTESAVCSAEHIRDRSYMAQ